MPRRVTDSQWRELVRDVLAIADLPRDYHVDIRRVPGLRQTAALGLTYAVDPDTLRFRVEVEHDVCHDLATEILIHEMAHVLDYHNAKLTKRDHGPTWGIYYAGLIRRYHQTQ